MADEENPITKIRERAAELFEDPDERDDYIQGRMARLGYKKGPGEWIREEDDDSPRDDDDEPMTRKEWRAIQREQAKNRAASTSTTPPKVDREKEKTPLKDKKDKGDNPWWR